MRNTRLKINSFSAFIIALITLLSACYTKHDYHTVTRPYNTMSLNGENLRDSGRIITVYVTDSATTYLDFYFELISADRTTDVVSLSLSGLPAGITDSIGAATYQLPLSLHMPLYATSADTGFHTIYVNTSGAYGLHTFPVRIHVGLPYDNAQGFAGNWRAKHDCGTDSCVMTISIIPGQPHWVAIRNIHCLGDSVVAFASVSNSMLITIPFQECGGFFIYGRRQLSGPSMYNEAGFGMLDTVIHGTDTMLCGSTWLRL